VETNDIENRYYELGVSNPARTLLYNLPRPTRGESRQIDASIEQLALDESKLSGVLCFRLAEYTGSVFIHEKVKRFLEKKNFPSVVFREVKDFISL
jgi:hypothetical protein